MLIVLLVGQGRRAAPPSSPPPSASPRPSAPARRPARRPRRRRARRPRPARARPGPGLADWLAAGADVPADAPRPARGRRSRRPRRSCPAGTGALGARTAADVPRRRCSPPTRGRSSSTAGVLDGRRRRPARVVAAGHPLAARHPALLPRAPPGRRSRRCGPSGVVLVAEEGRALGRGDVEDVLGVPVRRRGAGRPRRRPGRRRRAARPAASPAASSGRCAVPPEPSAGPRRRRHRRLLGVDGLGRSRPAHGRGRPARGAAAARRRAVAAGSSTGSLARVAGPRARSSRCSPTPTSPR